MTYQWDCWVYAFILAISEVNEFSILQYFVYCGLNLEGITTLLEFHWKLEWRLINNIYIGNQEGGVAFLPEYIHQLMTAPRHARRYHNRRWICTKNNSHQQYSCSFKRGKNMRTYCVCTPVLYICSDFNVNYVLIASSDG